MSQEIKYEVDLGAQIGVEDGKFVTQVKGLIVPAEIGEYGPKTGAMIFYDDKGDPIRAVFLEEIS